MPEKNLLRNQTNALLLRSLHWQRRQRCTLVCNLVIPPLLIILLSVLRNVVKPPAFTSLPFEQEPLGAFAARPFDPAVCLRNAKRRDAEVSFEQCARNPFVPDYVIPVFAPSSISSAVGGRTSADDEGQGLLSSFSLNPFAYPPAIDPSFPFFKSQTRYDGVLLHASFDGNATNPSYKAVVDAARKEDVDAAYNVSTIMLESRSKLLSMLYDAWYEGGLYSKFSTALAFNSLSQDNGDAGGISLSATLFYNESSSTNCTESCPLVSNVIRTYNAIYGQVAPGKSASVFLRRMPKVDPFDNLGIIPLIISILIAQLTHFLLPSFLRFLVLERVSRMRSLMASMGLGRLRYAIGTYLSLLSLYFISVLLIIITGLITRIPFFTENTPVSYLVLFFLWYVTITKQPPLSFELPFRHSSCLSFRTTNRWNFSLSYANVNYRGNVLVAFAMFLEPFFGDPETAQICGWFYIILVNVIGAPYIGQRLSDTDTSEGTWTAIMLLPTFAYMRSIFFAGAINSGGKGVTLTSTMYHDVQLGMCHGEGPFCRSYIFLIVEWVFLILAGSYFDRVLPQATGSQLHPLFFLGFKRKVVASAGNEINVDDERGEDVLDEEAKARNIVQNIQDVPFDGVVLHEFSKTYAGKPPVNALKNLSLVARKNDVICLLAHNGAGKTTAFRTLTGELEATSGAAFVNGHSVITDIENVHSSLGVAAQQDILWDVLNVQEHLYFYGRVKNLSGPALKDAVNYAVESVQLTNASKRQVKALSGGMKRRLSVSIAMMGDPDFVILDEPSTGLDIVARQKLWEAIERMRKDKVIMLTTHSLEEAEALSTRVAIMSEGELKCIGTVEDLKLRLGKGHRLMISLPASRIADLHQAITEIAPDASVETIIGGNVEYVLPRALAISSILTLMGQRRADLGITDWTINQSSLEDVFMKVTRRTNRQQFEEDGSKLV